MKMTNLSSAILTAILVMQPTQIFAQTVKTDSVDPVLETIAQVAEAQQVVEEPKAPPTAQEVLLGVCVENGYGEDCAKTLLGMMWKESNNIANAVGDKGKALGYFQIHYRMHKVSVECATDLACSAQWTINYMERNGYPKYKAYAVQCHNGCNVNNGYAASALRHGLRLWNQPLAIKLASAR